MMSLVTEQRKEPQMQEMTVTEAAEKFGVDGTATTDQWGTTWSDGEYNVPPAMLEAVGAGA
jgi:hypothetical protein